MLGKILALSTLMLIGYCWFAPPCQAQNGPDLIRPGYCPYLPPGTMGTCAQACMNDSACATNQKCCFNGCGRQCSPIHNVPMACNAHCPAGQQCQFQEPPWCYPVASCTLWPTCMPGGATTCTGTSCPTGQICQVQNGVPTCVPACQCPCPTSRVFEPAPVRSRSFFYNP